MTYPHIETQSDYAQFQDDFAQGAEGMDALSSGPCPGCADCGLEDCHDMDCPEYELAGESWFSSSPCDICNRHLGGDRHPAHYIAPKNELHPNNGTTIEHLSICVDCVYFMEYGQLDDMTMMEVS